MKIGEFASLCDVPKDTVRYYVNIGLLIPKMQGSQMNFAERELKDFHYIQKLKEMRFNIKEIKAFLYLRRMSNMIEPTTIDEYMELLEAKRESLQDEMKMLKNSIEMVDKEIKLFETKKNVAKTRAGGVPLSAIPLLVCPECRKQLNIENAEISYKYIYSGILSCSCGYQAGIENGIVKTGNVYEGTHDQPDLKRNLYHETGEDWAVYTQKCTDYILEEIEKHSWTGKVILEANVNGFFFLYNYLKLLPKDCTYIIVDKYEEVLFMYKNWIEMLFQDLDILYIADASEHYPLRDGGVDLLVSYFGENEYSFYHSNVHIEDVGNLIKPGGMVLGSFQSFAPGAKSRQLLRERYPEGHSGVADKDYLIDAYKRSGYEIEMVKVGEMLKTKKHHMYSCHEDGEPLNIYFFKAEGSKKEA